MCFYVLKYHPSNILYSFHFLPTSHISTPPIIDHEAENYQLFAAWQAARQADRHPTPPPNSLLFFIFCPERIRFISHLVVVIKSFQGAAFCSINNSSSITIYSFSVFDGD
jgi:hypothetical protein